MEASVKTFRNWPSRNCRSADHCYTTQELTDLALPHCSPHRYVQVIHRTNIKVSRDTAENILLPARSPSVITLVVAKWWLRSHINGGHLRHPLLPEISWPSQGKIRCRGAFVGVMGSGVDLLHTGVSIEGLGVEDSGVGLVWPGVGGPGARQCQVLMCLKSASNSWLWKMLMLLTGSLLQSWFLLLLVL